MKKLLLSLCLVFGIAVSIQAAIEGADVHVRGYDKKITIEWKSTKIGLVAGESMTVPLSKLATVTRYVPYERDLYFLGEDEGFTVTFTIPANWDGKAKIDATVALDMEIKRYQRISRMVGSFFTDAEHNTYYPFLSTHYGSPYLYEKSDRAIIAFQKSAFTVKEPDSSTIVDGIGKLKIVGKLTREIKVRMSYTYDGDDDSVKKMWIDDADSVVTIPAGAKTADFKFKYMGDNVPNVEDYLEVSFRLDRADSDVACYLDYEDWTGQDWKYSAKIKNSDYCWITMKDAQKLDFTGSFANQSGDKVEYQQDQTVDLVIESNLPNNTNDEWFYITFGGTAVYDEDYTLDFDAHGGNVSAGFSGKQYGVNLYGGTDSCKITVKYLSSAKAKKDKTLTMKITKVEMFYNPSLKCKVGKTNTANFTIKAPLPQVVGVARYGTADSITTLYIPNLEDVDAPDRVSVSDMTDTMVALNYKNAAAQNAYGFNLEGGYTAWLNKNQKDSSVAPLKLYGGWPVCKGVEFEVSIDSKGAYFEKSPSIKGSYFDPVKDPSESGKAKAVTAKAVTKISKDSKDTTFVVSVSGTPILYDKKALKTAYGEGKYFADVAASIQKLGAGVNMLITWKQGKTGEENQSYDEDANAYEYKNVWCGTVIAVGPEFRDSALTMDSVVTDTILVADKTVSVRGKFFTTAPKAYLEYTANGKVSTLSLKVTNAVMDGAGISTVDVVMPNDKKLGNLGTDRVYLVIDNGSALTAVQVFKP